MKEVIAVVEAGQVVLPKTVTIPDGTTLRLMWEEQDLLAPYEAEPWTEEDLQADLEWANGKRFTQ